MCCPGLVCGVTSIRPGDAAGSATDYGLSSGGSTREVEQRYERLAAHLRLGSVAVARQVHGARIVSLSSASAPARGVHVLGEADGLATDASGLLLVVTVADCVPVFLADSAGRKLALLHAGWRGVAAEILERGMACLTSRYGVPKEDMRVHFGPAICGSCYEVGPEVREALGLPASPARTVDLREVLASRAVAAGIPSHGVSRSEDCTLCGPRGAYSHRGGGSAAGRMAAFLGRVVGT